MEEKHKPEVPRGLYFEEFTGGQKLISPGRTVTEADVVSFAALTGDWTRLHTDAAYAAQQLFGQRVAHGMLGISIASALTMRLGILEETILAFREINHWKFVLPVFLGDTIHVQAVVHETRAVPRLCGGLVTLEIEVLNQDDKVVQRGRWSVLVKSQTPS